MKNLSEKSINLLNTKKGIKFFIREPDITPLKAVRIMNYENKLKKLQAELIKLQKWVETENEKVVILFEGRDAAGKGGAIRRITQHLNPREFRVVALPRPTVEEKGEWYFQRYINNLPRKGKIVFFDRSWYNRAVVEPVNGFCTEDDYQIFMNQVNEFERMIIESGIRLIKFYFSISKNEQARRFRDIKSSPVKKWKFSKVDQAALKLWDSYTDYKNRMFEKTNTEISPWIIIKANRKSSARLEAIRHILNIIPYKSQENEV